ncbi:hypothetical protein TNCV_3739291 [Trichonephila clavipes]|nr:hypothetical protein TNCV_3739291 [Trichonephila clavipes]
MLSDRGPRNSSLQGASSFEHHTGDSTIWLDTTSIFRGNTLGWSGTSHFSSPSTNLTRGLATRRLFRVPPCRKGTLPLQTHMPSPGFELRLNGTAVSVTNRYTRWVNKK